MLLLEFGKITFTDDGYIAWTISNLLSAKSWHYLYVKSPQFESESGSHYMALCFDRRTNWVLLSFTNMNQKPSARLEVNLGAMEGDGKSILITQVGYTDKCGYLFIYNWMTLGAFYTKFNQIQNGDGLTIYCKVIKMTSKDDASENETSDSNSHEEETNSKSINKMLEDLKSLLVTGEDSDVKLRVGDKEFPAHRSILRARSPVFKAMFSNEMVEKESGTVDIDDCDPEKFPDFLTYVYSGSTRHITVQNVLGLYAASDKYLMGELKEACVSFMKTNMSVESFCDITTLALRHDETELVELSTKFFSRNAEEIMEAANWVPFLRENPEESNELFIKPLSRR